MENALTDTAQYRLLVLGDGSVRTIPLLGTRWIVGRSQDCQVPLHDPTVSRKHLLLERLGEAFHFRDLGGSNPVLLDGKPAKEGEVGIGQTLAIGLSRLVLQERNLPAHLHTTGNPTVVISREVADAEATAEPAATPTLATTATHVLARIEWAFADLGSLAHAAEPLLDLALSLTARRVGWIGRIGTQGQTETLASLDVGERGRVPRLPVSAVLDARRIAQPHLLTTQDADGAKALLLVPLGNAGEGLLVLDDPVAGAPTGQELLRLARSLSPVVWHRLQETAERLRLRDELQRLRFHGTAAHNAILASSRLQDARVALRTLASNEVPALLVGEEGTELDDLARYYHAESPHRNGPFVPWNAAQVPEWRHERDLFGDSREPTGELRRAQGGTLFIQHIERLAPPVQQRLAAAMRGSDPKTARTTLVAASNLPLDSHAEDTGIAWTAAQRIEVPPLRSNARDVMALAELFLAELGPNANDTPRLISDRARRLLVNYPWPGNVRELRLALEAAAAQAGDQQIAPRHLPTAIAQDSSTPVSEVPTLEEMERQHILAVMDRTGGNRSRTAQLLGIATSTLYEKMKRYGIDG